MIENICLVFFFYGPTTDAGSSSIHCEEARRGKRRRMMSSWAFGVADDDDVDGSFLCRYCVEMSWRRQARRYARTFYCSYSTPVRLLVLKF